MPDEVLIQSTTRPGTSGMAVASFVLGILSPLSLGVTALIGLVLGVAAVVQIMNKEKRRGGMGLAIAGIIVSCIMLVVIPVVLNIILVTRISYAQ